MTSPADASATPGFSETVPKEEHPALNNPLMPLRVGRTTGGIWDAQRAELYELLGRQSPICAQLYREAVELLGARDLDIAKVALAGHAVRELVNLLPSVLGDSKLPERVHDATLRDLVVAGWREHRLQSTQAAGVPEVLTRELSEAIERWVRAQEQIGRNADARRAALIGEEGSALDGTLKVLDEAIKIFERRRHPTLRDAVESSDAAVYVHALTVIENVITSRVLGFFDTKSKLRATIEAANARNADGTWTRPSADDVSATLARLGGMQHRRVFFDQLNNPEWICPLDTFGALDPPSAGQPPEEFAWQPWPAGDYLVRMAEHRSSQVRKMLCSKVCVDAAWSAKLTLLPAALRMPVEEAGRLMAACLKRLGDEHLRYLSSDGLALVEMFAASEYFDEALRLAQRLLRPRALDRRGLSHDIGAGVDSAFYADALKRVTAALEPDGRLLPTLYAWLCAEQELSGRWKASAQLDTSDIWRPSISDHPQNFRHDDIADALVDAIRERAVHEISSGRLGDVIELLEKDQLPIAMRVVLFALSTQVDLREDALAAAADRVLDPGVLHRPWGFREYAQLASATLPQLGDSDFQRWEDLVDAGPRISEASRQRIAERREADQTEDTAVDEYVTRRRHELLSAVGPNALRGRLLECHLRMVAELGEYRNAGFRAWHSSGFGERRPAIGEELARMTVDEVLETLCTWEPGSDDAGTKDGLAEALCDAVVLRPRQFSERTGPFLLSGEPYSSRFLDGIRRAAEADVSSIDWRGFIGGVEAMDSAGEGSSDRVVYARGQVCHTIDLAAGSENLQMPLALLDRATGIVARWMAETRPDDGVELGADHYTNALNDLRPTAVRTLIRIGVMVRCASDEGADCSKILDSVQIALQGVLAPRDASLAVAAALGEGLGSMLWTDASWTASWLAGATSDDPWGDVVVTTALAVNTTSTPLMTALWPAIDRLLDRAAASEAIELGWPTSGRSILEHIGDHLMILAMWKKGAPWPNRTASFFSRVPAEIAASVLGHLGWRLSATDDLSPDLIERAQTIWDERQRAVSAGQGDQRQLAEFGRWVQGGKFPTEWWVPRLASVVEILGCQDRSHFGEQIELAAHTHPGQAIDLLSQLLRLEPRRTFSRYDLLRHAPTVIALGFKAPDFGVRQAAQSLMDLLGEQGHVDMDEQVEQAAQSLPD